MKQISIPHYDIEAIGLAEASQMLDKELRHSLDCVNWPAFPYKPQVACAMACNSENLLLKFYVEELHPRAITSQINGPVFEDSCCEVFFAFDQSGYYNLETNCGGTQLFGWKNSLGEKTRATETTIKCILKHSSLGSALPIEIQGLTQWELTLIIPSAACFRHPGIRFASGMQFAANFYKCGDKTPNPHFLSWSPIQSPRPNFHLPEFFGKVVVE